MRTFAQKPKAAQQTASSKSTKPSREFLGQSRNVKSVLYLQRTVVNQSVPRFLQTATENIDANSSSKTSTGFSHDFSRTHVYPEALNTIQPKLKVNVSKDRYEQEANRVGETVATALASTAQLPSSHLAGKLTTGHSSMRILGREAAIGMMEQNRPVRAAPADIQQVVSRQKGTGKSLESGIRASMQEIMETDFSNVRVHADDASDDLALALQAKAFTVGNDIFFRKNSYQSGSIMGKRLLVHELTHVLQQRRSGETRLQRFPDATLTSIGSGAEYLGNLASARWLWVPITSQLAEWEAELDRIGEQGAPTNLGSALLIPVSMLFVVLQAIVGLLDLLARLNPMSLVLRGAATSVRAHTGEYTSEDFMRDALSVGEQALDIITLGLRHAFQHLEEGIRESNVFRITQAVSEIALAAMAIFGIFRAIRARTSAGRMATAVADESARLVDVLDRPGTITENPPSSERFSVRESHGTNRFGEPEARYYAEAWLDEQGVLEGDFMLRRPAEELGMTPTEGSSGFVRSSQLRGGTLYRRALEFLRRRHGTVRGLRGRWGAGDNLAAFNETYARLRAQGIADAAARQVAALDTFTGQIATSEGYTRVHIESATFDAASNAFSEVIVVFYRP